MIASRCMNLSRRGVAAVALALVLGFAAGCMSTTYTSGRPIEQSKVDMIQKGQTTMDDIIMMFGAPSSTVPMGQTTLYTYKYTKSKSKSFFIMGGGNTNMDESSDELTIKFDDNGKVQTYSISRGVTS